MIFRPTKNDIRQIDVMVSHNCSTDYIREVLGLSPAEWLKWMDKSEVSAALAKRKDYSPERFTLNHPDIEGQTEIAFEVNMVKFYRFKKEFSCPAGRYKYIYRFLREHDLRMNLETLTEYVKGLKNCLNGGTKGKEILIGEAWRILHNMETRVTLPFDPEGIKRLSSVVYFTDDEDLSTYDYEAGNKKIKFWEENKTHDFFLTQPISELLNLSNFSQTSLEEYLNQASEILKELTLDQQTQ